MEFKGKTFTPKSASKADLRYNPYRSGSNKAVYRPSMSNFQKQNLNAYKKKCDSTPPNKLSISKKVQQTNSLGRPNFSRTYSILRNSQQRSEGKENSVEGQWISKTDSSNTFSSVFSKSAKRSLALSNSESCADDSHKPNVLTCEDDDDDDDNIFLSDRYKTKDLDKENNNATKNNSNTGTSLLNNNKRKPLNTLHSSILHEISPKRGAFSNSGPRSSSSKKDHSFTFKSFGNKENDTTQISETEQITFPNLNIEYPYLIGFPNYGNTCYLNAVLQTLVSLESFVEDVNTVISRVDESTSSLTHSLWDVVVGRKNKDPVAVTKALRNFKENVEKVDGSFSGFKMQDANEFLTQVLDTMKDEIDKYLNTDCNDSTMISLPSLFNHSRKQTNFESNDQSSLFSTPSPDSLVSLDLKQSDCNNSDDENDDLFANKNKIFNCISNGTPEKSLPTKSSVSPFIKKETPAKTNMCTSSGEAHINPVKENFEFELLESYRCLGCGQVEGRKQKHFALYVNLPTEGSESIQTAVESYMSEDQRELTCENCSHKKASVITRFENFPRILIVQLKRYEFKPEQLECIKVSSKVEVNMWLQLDSLASQSAKAPPAWKNTNLSICNPNEARFIETKTCNTLSLRNLSSELNICDSIDIAPSHQEDSDVANAETVPVMTEEDKKNEEQELEEVMIRSLEDVGGANTSSNEHNPDREEEEIQKAIKLSLLEMGMCYSHDQESNLAEKDHFTQEDIKENEVTLPELNGRHSYRLLSVISHFGLTTCTGHYVSDIFNFNENQWFHYDDESVVQLQDSVVLADGRQKNGYIFFYIHQDVYRKLRRLK